VGGKASVALENDDLTQVCAHVEAAGLVKGVTSKVLRHQVWHVAVQGGRHLVLNRLESIASVNINTEEAEAIGAGHGAVERCGSVDIRNLEGGTGWRVHDTELHLGKHLELFVAPKDHFEVGLATKG